MKYGYLIAAAGVSSVLAGCGAMAQREEVKSTVADGISNIRAQIQAQREVEKEQAKSVTIVKGVWLGAKAVKVSRDVTLPPVFHKKIQFQFPDKPTLPLLAERLTKVSMIPVRVTADAYETIEAFAARRNVGSSNKDQTNDAKKPSGQMLVAPVMPMPMPLPGTPNAQLAPLPAAMNGAEMSVDKRLFLDRSSPYFGTLYQLLDQISAVYGVGWDFKDGEIEISRLVTRIYQIANINDVNESSASVGKSGKVGTAASGGQESSSTDSASSDITNKITDKVDVVVSMKDSISTVLTPNVGKVTISTSGLITVHDTREIQRQVKEMVDAENAVMGRQVRMRITFLDMKASISNDMGFSWEYIVNMATRKYQASISSPSGLPGGSTGFGTIGLSRISGSTQTDFFIKALSEMGNVAVMKDESFTIMNNRNISVAAVDTFTYPARQTPGTTVGIGGVATAGVEPGTLVTGTFLNLRASIQPNGSVVSRFSFDGSNKGKIQTFMSNGVPLQFPNSNADKYHLYAAIRTGQAGIIAAIDNSQSEVNDRSLDSKLSPILGGGIQNSVVRRATLVILSPEIIEGSV
ncbi:hypothetical protein [Comamonas testosteroni]|uniref:hypothetical protein n=1 Tax=Comamonas testosteroni TaxID=285 RepID=UPI000AA96985|nr:hypothetical protein [Comamonas testosteroni]